MTRRRRRWSRCKQASLTTTASSQHDLDHRRLRRRCRLRRVCNCRRRYRRRCLSLMPQQPRDARRRLCHRCHRLGASFHVRQTRRLAWSPASRAQRPVLFWRTPPTSTCCQHVQRRCRRRCRRGLSPMRRSPTWQTIRRQARAQRRMSTWIPAPSQRLVSRPTRATPASAARCRQVMKCCVAAQAAWSRSSVTLGLNKVMHRAARDACGRMRTHAATGPQLSCERMRATSPSR